MRHVMSWMIWYMTSQMIPETRQWNKEQDSYKLVIILLSYWGDCQARLFCYQFTTVGKNANFPIPGTESKFPSIIAKFPSSNANLANISYVFLYSNDNNCSPNGKISQKQGSQLSSLLFPGMQFVPLSDDWKPNVFKGCPDPTSNWKNILFQSLSSIWQPSALINVVVRQSFQVARRRPRWSRMSWTHLGML